MPTLHLHNINVLFHNISISAGPIEPKSSCRQCKFYYNKAHKKCTVLFEYLFWFCRVKAYTSKVCENVLKQMQKRKPVYLVVPRNENRPLGRLVIFLRYKVTNNGLPLLAVRFYESISDTIDVISTKSYIFASENRKK